MYYSLTEITIIQKLIHIKELSNIIFDKVPISIMIYDLFFYFYQTKEKENLHVLPYKMTKNSIVMEQIYTLCFCRQITVLTFFSFLCLPSAMTRPIIPDGQIFRWHIFYVWDWSDIIRIKRRRRSCRSCYICVPTNDQVHLSQVWIIRRDWKSWCFVYFTN